MPFKNKIILSLSIPLSVLLVLAGCIGLSTKNFYVNETANWKLQSVTQDAIDLFFVTPALILAALFSRKYKAAFLLWGGVNLYLVYTYVIYCFDVHFNSLFIVYCLSLGLSFYSLLYFLISACNKNVVASITFGTAHKLVAVYFIIIAVLFYVLWLGDILPAIINGTVPQVLTDTALPTNPVHVLDLSVVLPAILVVGVLSLKKKVAVLLLIPVVLVFFILMDITIAAISFVIQSKGAESSYMLSIIMSALALFSFILLVTFLRNTPLEKEINSLTK